ncbi:MULTISPECIES: hypothetical protein [Pseudomonadaceae]|uniref:DUF1566 domain-containing protein n=1 Tax=Pseudomonas abyssi TaxID=170540 RepID=A0A395R2T1_9PSED|nr:hypothetical protein [Halopseudomonas gallaeciensis]RGP54411.1 hypothetical protein ASB58_11055 [Halopseudomonas gallaeciensis]
MIRGTIAASAPPLAPPIELPETIGEAFGGGYYVGDLTLVDGPDAGVYAIIFAPPTPAVSLPYKTSATATPGADSERNGASNTAAIIADGIGAYPAAEFCVNYSREGYEDWYLPAPEEVKLVWLNRGMLPAYNMTTYVSTSLQQQVTNYRRWFLIADYPPSSDPGTYQSVAKTTSTRVIPCRRIRKP